MQVIWFIIIGLCCIVISLASNLAPIADDIFKEETKRIYKIKPKNAYKTFNPSKMFPDLFWTKDEISRMKYKNKDGRYGNLGIGRILTYKRIWRFTDLGIINRCRHRNRGKCIYRSPCCETEWSADVPKKIEYKNSTYNVVQPLDGYQVIFRGSCKYKTNCTYGTCKEENSYFTYVLVEDLSLNNFPPVKFIPIAYPRMCHCVNIT